MSKTERAIQTQIDWNKFAMPCVDCILADLCKCCNSIERPNFNPEFFEVSVTCKRKNDYAKKAHPDDIPEILPMQEVRASMAKETGTDLFDSQTACYSSARDRRGMY